MQYSWIFLTINFDYLQKSLQLAYKNEWTRRQENKRTRGQEKRAASSREAALENTVIYK